MDTRLLEAKSHEEMDGRMEGRMIVESEVKIEQFFESIEQMIRERSKAVVRQMEREKRVRVCVNKQ